MVWTVLVPSGLPLAGPRAQRRQEPAGGGPGGPPAALRPVLPPALTPAADIHMLETSHCPLQSRLGCSTYNAIILLFLICLLYNN